MQNPSTKISVRSALMTGLLLPLSAQAQAPEPAQPAVRLQDVTVIATTPLLGSGVSADTVPGQVDVLGASDIKAHGAPSLTQALSDKVGGVAVANAAGNPFQPDLFYHGYRASALQGVEQGLAVYVNGVRFNQAFGDTVNWDLIPNVAIDQVNLEGANPAFGLNALGGALNVQLKNGFTHQGGELTLSGGSFGRVEGDLEYGRQSGNTAVYLGLSAAHQGGWRSFQSSDVQNLYSDVGWRGTRSELHISLMAANAKLNGPGTSPIELLAANRKAQFTGPNEITNRALQLVVSDSTELSDDRSLQANAYYGYFQQRVINGNVAGFAPCASGSGLLCADSGNTLTTQGGTAISDFLAGGPYSQLDRHNTITQSWGSSVQVTDEAERFGRRNRLVAGLSYDGSLTRFSAQSLAGGLTANTRNFIGPGVLIDQEDGSNTPVSASITNANLGAFFADTLDITDRLTATVSARANATSIRLSDRLGTALNGHHSYDRVNPALGATYRVAPWLNLYAGYSEANRAPTPAELSCASAAAPCSLANFFVGDPDLKQVVSRTVEVGLRGKTDISETAKLSYQLGVFHSELSDDIQFINSQSSGRAYFQNVGRTLRQGVDASVKLETGRVSLALAYAWTDATFRTGFTERAGNNPAADADGNVTIRPGNKLPGVAAHQVKLNARYRLADDWTIGSTLHYASGTHLFGDEANLTPKLPGYLVMNVSTSYQVLPSLELFGEIENVTNRRYYVYGTFSPTSSVVLAQAPGATNPRSYNIAAPIGGYAGLRWKF